jgi:predicted PhzF superfamily epimerase YddE/YHI9
VVPVTSRDEAAPSGPTGSTRCLTWQESGTAVAVQCETDTGEAITFCGHGLLGAAHYWQHNGYRPQRLAMGGATFAYSHESGVGWIGCDTPMLSPVAVPAWTDLFTGSAPLACAEAGDNAGYLVLEWPQDTDLAGLKPPGDRLQQHTMRALIATCRISPGNSLAGEDIQLRYFAPQYGVDEDVATGSAMRVLAS